MQLFPSEDLPSLTPCCGMLPVWAVTGLWDSSLCMLVLILCSGCAVHQLAVLDSVYTTRGRTTKTPAQVRLLATLHFIWSWRMPE